MPFKIKTQPNEPGALVITDDKPGEIGRFVHVTVHSFERRMSSDGDVETFIIQQDPGTLAVAEKIAELLA